MGQNTGRSTEEKTIPKHALIFADGACSKNPGPGGWGVVAFLPAAPKLSVPAAGAGEVRELGGADPASTNNIMELEAACQALALCRQEKVAGPITVCCDSKYVLQGITQWVWGWQRNGWKRADGQPVLNQESWRRLAELALQFERGQLTWTYVAGHAGIAGNDRADRIAVGFSVGPTPTLYRGPAEAYALPIFEGWQSQPADAESGSSKKPKKKKSGTSGKSTGPIFGPAFYLSLVDGKLVRHATWSECEARVKGQSKARFKKISSSEEQAQTLLGWGLSTTTPAE